MYQLTYARKILPNALVNWSNSSFFYPYKMDLRVVENISFGGQQRTPHTLDRAEMTPPPPPLLDCTVYTVY